MKKIFVKIALLLLPALFLWAACGGGKAPVPNPESNPNAAGWGPNAALYDEVMQLHDSAMARMGEIAHLSRSLKPYRTTAVPHKGVDEAYFQLQNADIKMMDWMHQFVSDPALLPAQNDAERTQYLNDEKRKITQVAQDIDESIRVADSLLVTLRAK